MGKPVPAEAERPAIVISDSSEYEIDLHSGWLTRVFYRRLLQSHLMRQIDTHEITLKHCAIATDRLNSHLPRCPW